MSPSLLPWMVKVYIPSWCNVLWILRFSQQRLW
jgi:hypothetical protein